VASSTATPISPPIHLHGVAQIKKRGNSVHNEPVAVGDEHKLAAKIKAIKKAPPVPRA